MALTGRGVKRPILVNHTVLQTLRQETLLIVSSVTRQISIRPFYGENGSMFGVGEVMVMLVIRTHLAGDTSPEQSNCQ